MHHLETALDPDHDNLTLTIIVIKHGNATGMTIGCANNMFSFICEYDIVPPHTSLEWAILPFTAKSGPFS
jgi:hypothetical protein